MSGMENFVYIGDFDTQIMLAKARVGDHYTMNEKNMDKFKAVYDFFVALADENDGGVARLDVSPESIHACVAINVPNVDLHGDSMKQFVEILWCVDTFEIERLTADSLLISAGVNCVWEVAASE